MDLPLYRALKSVSISNENINEALTAMNAQVNEAVGTVNTAVAAEMKVLGTKIDAINMRIDNLRDSNRWLIASIFTALAMFAAAAKFWGH